MPTGIALKHSVVPSAASQLRHVAELSGRQECSLASPHGWALGQNDIHQHGGVPMTKGHGEIEWDQASRKRPGRVEVKCSKINGCEPTGPAINMLGERGQADGREN